MYNSAEMESCSWGSDDVRLCHIPLLRDALIEMLPIDLLSPGDCSLKVDAAYGSGNPCKGKSQHSGYCSEDRDPSGDFGTTFEPKDCFAEALDLECWNLKRYTATRSWFVNKWQRLLEPEHFNNALRLLDCFLAHWDTPAVPPTKKAKSRKKGPEG